MSLGAPLWLLLLGVVAALVAVDALRPWPTTGPRKALAVAIRSLVGILLVLALARPSVVLPAGEARTVFVVDTSASLSDARLAEALDRAEALRGEGAAALVSVDGAPRVVVPPGAEWVRPVREVAVSRTDLGAGIQAGLGLVDPAAGGRIVLVTDGVDTGGRLLEAAATARARGVPVDVVLLPEPPADARVSGLDLRAPVVRPGETLSADVTLRGGTEGEAAGLEIRVDDAVVARQPVVLPGAGRRRVAVEHPLPPDVAPGAHRLEVRLVDAASSRQADDDRMATGFAVGPSPQVLLVTSEPRELEAMGRALRAEGMETTILGPDALSPDLLVRTDLVVLGDVPVAGGAAVDEVLPPDFLEALRRWVSAGGGLVTLGGDRTYELGGWGDSPLAAVVPLDLAPSAEDVEPAVALVQVLDSSASMGDWTGYHTKMALANEGAVASMRLLRPKDFLGVMEVDTRVRWAVTVQPVTDPLRLSAAIRGIQPSGGGIYTYTALVAAEAALQEVATELRHVVLYADAQDLEEKVDGLPFGMGPGPNVWQVAGRLAEQGITLSVIALGDPRDQDVAVMRDLARIGQGRFHITREPEELKALFVEETRQVVQSVVHDTPFRARRVQAHPIVAGVDVGGAPPLLGYVEVEARETATTVLEGPGGLPVLATWRYGLGAVASWSTDLGSRWGRRWIEAPLYAPLVVQQARWALRPPLSRGAGIAVSPADGGMRVEVQRRDARGLSLDDPGLAVEVVDPQDPGAEPVRRHLHLEEPGRWAARVPAPPGAARRVRVVVPAAEDRVVGEQEVVVPEPLERGAPDRAQLVRVVTVTGGVVDPERAGPPSTGLGAPRPVAWLLLVLAVLLLPLDAWLRHPARG